MCQAISILITKSKKVYWKAGVDSHDQLVELFKKKDKELKDDKKPPLNTFARIEIVPHDGNYLKPKQKWDYKIDEEVKPDWLDKSYEKPCRLAEKLWKKEIYSQFNLKEVLNPIYPFKIKPPKITKKHIDVVKLWASVWDSVWASVRDSVWASVGASVWASVGASVRDSVWASVWDSVRDSVWDSVWASVGVYSGSMFPKIKKWKYVDKRKSPFNKIKGYPFQSAVWLWKQGLVASFDGSIWRLHGSPKGNGKIKTLWECKKEDL
jgi:hypothetical protein